MQLRSKRGFETSLLGVMNSGPCSAILQSLLDQFWKFYVYEDRLSKVSTKMRMRNRAITGGTCACGRSVFSQAVPGVFEDVLCRLVEAGCEESITELLECR